MDAGSMLSKKASSFRVWPVLIPFWRDLIPHALASKNWLQSADVRLRLLAPAFAMRSDGGGFLPSI